MRNFEQNRNARITEVDFGSLREVQTHGRDFGTMTARADIRERTDTESGRSLRGLSVTTAGGRNVRFSGREARTLLRVLERAAYGY